MFIFNMHDNNMDAVSMLLACMLNMNKNAIFGELACDPKHVQHLICEQSSILAASARKRNPWAFEI